MVKPALIEEADAFTVDFTDIGDITSTNMEIKLSDKTLFQLNYHPVPRPLYAELKAHIEGLFDKDWIDLSTSSY